MYLILLLIIFNKYLPFQWCSFFSALQSQKAVPAYFYISNLFIHAPITIITSAEVYNIYFFNNGYKRDPQMALLKAASM